MTEMTRDQFFSMAGIQGVEGAYTPISLGKGSKTRNGNRAWMRDLRNVDFIDAESLRQQTPETVTATDVVVNGEVLSAYKAIVGDRTGKCYSIRSERYQIA